MEKIISKTCIGLIHTNFKIVQTSGIQKGREKECVGRGRREREVIGIG